MPFQSDKQRRYLWANEPEIAREWTDRYGARGGGIMRVPLANGSLRGHPLYGTERPQSFNKPHKYTGNISSPAEREAINQINKSYLPYMEERTEKESTGQIPYNTGEFDWINMGKGDEIFPRTEPGSDLSNQMYKDAYGWGNEPRVGEDTSDLSGMAEVKTPIAQKFANLDKFVGPHDPSVYDKWGTRRMAEEKLNQYPQKRGNIFQQGWQGAKKGWQGIKDFKTSIGEGITGILDNTMIGKIAAMNNALNPRAWNYNPALQGQIDYLKGSGDYGVMDATGLNKITGGVLAGKNLQSMFGVNDLGKLYDKSIARTQKTLDNFGKKWSRLKKDDPDEYKRIEAFHRNKLKQKEREKKLAGIAASKDLERRKTASRDKWQKDYSTWTSPSGRDHVTTGGIGSPESKKGPAGGSIGASRFLARGGRASYFNGGLASLWRR